MVIHVIHKSLLLGSGAYKSLIFLRISATMSRFFRHTSEEYTVNFCKTLHDSQTKLPLGVPPLIDLKTGTAR